MLAGSVQVHPESAPLQLASVTHRMMKNDPKNIQELTGAKVKVDNFVEGTEKIQVELQRRQHEFQAAQAEKHREWVERRDYERNEFDQKLQQQAEEHQSNMA